MKQYTLPSFLFLLSTVFFVLIAFLPTLENKSFPSFYPFFWYVLDIIVTHFGAFVLVFFTVLLLFVLIHKAKTTVVFRKNILFSSLYIFMSVFFGFLFAYLLLFVIAFFHINSFSVMTHINSRAVGVITDVHEIISSLTSQNTPPKIVETDENTRSLLFEMASVTTGEETFYGKYIVPAFPSFLAIPNNSLGGNIVLIDNTLFITDINSQEARQISPVVGYLLVKDSFWDTFIKSYPSIVHIDKESYLVYRSTQFTTRDQTLDAELEKFEDSIGTVSAQIQEDEFVLGVSTNRVEELQDIREKEYRDCIAEGYYEEKEFIRVNSKSDCQPIRDRWNVSIEDEQSLLDETEARLEENDELLTRLEETLEAFSTQKVAADIKAGHITFERGKFEPPQTIQIADDRELVPTLSDYYAILVHEYLHYTSFIATDRKLKSSFFEEGLTEYFARKVIAKHLDANTNIGYPVHTKIIGEITRLIPESELWDIYMTKDNEALERTLDRVYGDGFYDENFVYFEAFSYTSDISQVISLTNHIMEEINGEPFSPEDFLQETED